MQLSISKYMPIWLVNRFTKDSKPQYQDTIIDAIAIAEIIWSDDEMLTSLKESENGGVWAAREAVASKIMPTVRIYYSQFGEDVDFDCVFIEPLLIAMFRNKWCMNSDYSSVCIETRNQWLQ